MNVFEQVFHSKLCSHGTQYMRIEWWEGFASCNAFTKLGKVDLEKRDRNAKIKKFYEKLVTTQPF